MKKFWLLLFVALGAWLALNPTHARAATTVVLHPAQTNDNTATANTGAPMPELAALPSVNGATFSAYDITTLFDEKAATDGQLAAQAAIARDWDRYVGDYKAVQTATAVDGAVTFTALPTTADNLDRVYLFAQTAGPSDLLKPQPTILGLDGTDRDYTLYPKSTGADLRLTIGDTPITTGVHSVPRGTVLTYTAQFTLPSSLAAESSPYTALTIATGATADGTVPVPDSVTVTHNGTPIAANWLTLNQAIDLAKLPAAAGADLAALAGKTIQVSYQRRVVDPQPTADITGTLTITWQGVDAPTVLHATSAAVETGGQRFTAVNPFDKQPVAGGSFVVRREQAGTTQYALFSPDDFTWVTSRDEATSFTADGDGQIRVEGLEAGDYALEQLDAADGYRAATPRISFTVAKAAPGTDEAASITVWQTPLTGILPATGGLSLLVLALFGAALTSLGLYRRRHVRA
ncbi:pilin N-terminal domain-containing protein [Lacticaseibacillus kribbianus]|uniref:pilin N-terminal domain-containing protein n=1 Tax=Lacticaseibacillus kribbianus TaxID=2926292 RepID=UPI001CD241FF|nr:SpaA isopeptide-forming pilin-related protein [Lacticaseibacillus kribbianus]